MIGRRIRWENAVRAAALVAAGVAVLAALPSLLGPAEPAPPPADVGLAALPEPVPAPAPAVPTPAPLPPEAPKTGKRGAVGAKPDAKRRSHEDQDAPPGSRRRPGRPDDSPTPSPAAAPTLVAPAPIHVAPPPSRERFGFEG